MSRAFVTAALVVRRTISASAEELFDAWLDPEALAIWMRPDGVLATTARNEPRVGGAYEIIMEVEDGAIAHRGTYKQIERPTRLSFTWTSQPTENCETLVTVDFIPRGAGTEVIVTHERLPENAQTSHQNGWTSALARLNDTHLKGSPA